jgi:hypothetical protein
MSREMLTPAALEGLYKQSIEGLTEAQVDTIEDGSEETTTFFPRMRQARSLWERLQEQRRFTENRESWKSPILLHQ